MRRRFCLALVQALCVLTLTGCGRFVAHRMVQSPNTYPSWLRPSARVTLALDDYFSTNVPPREVRVGPPGATLNYRVVEPRDYKYKTSFTNWMQNGRPHYSISCHVRMPGETNIWSTAPRGTVVLLHGYGMAQFAMTPWALGLAHDGWRTVLVDLRGHGKSTGRRISYGINEVHDLSQLLDALERDGQLAQPVAVMGDSYGAALAIRWRTVEPRLDKAIAISPYAELSKATLSIVRDNARWIPTAVIRAGLKQLPEVLKVPADELDTLTTLTRRPVKLLLVTGEKDTIAPPAEVRRLFEAAEDGSEFFIIPNATHEAAPYFFTDLVPRVESWLKGGQRSASVQ